MHPLSRRARPWVFAACAWVQTAAQGHGVVYAQYGGTVQSVNDVAYELAAHEHGLMLYVDDHGNPVPTDGVKGRLFLIDESSPREFELKPAGQNRMLAMGAQRQKDQHARAMLVMPSGRHVSVRFTGLAVVQSDTPPSQAPAPPVAFGARRWFSGDWLK